MEYEPRERVESEEERQLMSWCKSLGKDAKVEKEGETLKVTVSFAFEWFWNKMGEAILKKMGENTLLLNPRLYAASKSRFELIAEIQNPKIRFKRLEIFVDKRED